MFWSLVLDGDNYYNEPIERSFHVSQLALDINTIEENRGGLVQLWIKKQRNKTLLATVSRKKLQVKLDLAFESGEKVKFFKIGRGTIHLSGYYIPQEKVDLDETIESDITRKKVKRKKTSMIDHDNNDGQHDLNFTSFDMQQEEVVLPSGISHIDIVEGEGRRADVGDVVRIHYENRLESTGNIVGRMTTGDGITVTLGKSEKLIIEGLETGIMGMKVGAKRKVTSPPEHAYGKNGIAPFIPANATVISTVTLLSIETPMS